MIVLDGRCYQSAYDTYSLKEASGEGIKKAEQGKD